jgi:hypothetical protein
MTTKKHAFYGILALVSLLGLGITDSASAAAYTFPGSGYTFTGTLSFVSVTGERAPDPVPFSVGDPFTGYAFYDPATNIGVFGAATSNGFSWGERRSGTGSVSRFSIQIRSNSIFFGPLAPVPSPPTAI